MSTSLPRILMAIAMFCVTSGAAWASAAGPEALFAEAEKSYQSGAYEAAIASYKTLIEKHPKDWRTAQARFTTGFILQKKLKRPQQARAAYEKVIQHNPNSPLARNSEFHIAEIYEQTGDTDKAIGQYKVFLNKANRHPREGLAKKKIELLNQKMKGQPAVPRGWATTIDRQMWRRVERAIGDDQRGLKENKGKPKADARPPRDQNAPKEKKNRPRAAETGKPLE